MRQAAKTSGMVPVLDYNHVRNEWEPDPPEEFMNFYRAFLAWRHANRWDNEIADHLPELLRFAGLVDIQTQIQDEIVERADPDFPERSALWSEVIENVGGQVTNAGFCTISQLREARERYDSWLKTDLIRQTLTMRAVTGRVA
jgi:hypothetical protein